MADLRSIAYDQLGTDSSTPEAAAGFMDALIEIGDELLQFETEIVAVSLGYTGWAAQRTFADPEDMYVSLVQEIQQAREAVMEGEPYHFDRCEHDFQSIEQNVFMDYRPRYDEQLTRLQQLSERVGRLLEGKRSTANSRLIAALSGCAVVISVVSLLVSVVV